MEDWIWTAAVTIVVLVSVAAVRRRAHRGGSAGVFTDVQLDRIIDRWGPR